MTFFKIVGCNKKGNDEKNNTKEYIALIFSSNSEWRMTALLVSHFLKSTLYYLLKNCYIIVKLCWQYAIYLMIMSSDKIMRKAVQVVTV